MAGSSTSELIFFIASLIVATGLAAAVGTTTLSISKSMHDNGMILSEQYKSSITVINDPVNTFNNIYVKNTGRTILYPDLVDVFIDGTFTYVNNSTIEEGTHWTRGDVLNITAPLPNGTHTVRVVVESGVSDTFIYRK
ncbi:MAG: Archaebacterial flagellin [Candidatus Argoarchaeum ethanivorans]|uniref:Archaebacterial flagellin n=1 Tax=Candidatus Argoarchaeum ethanivorans TaxID=2608793 RepID=A0A811TAZ7_9EURY|nr:MAG: Archaebacterial flagellin [Candidatus Argoarchaeum ethanivorans]